MITPHALQLAASAAEPATVGVTINPKIGIGDTVQFSSLPENYFRATGKKLIDYSRSWIFDHNPFVVRTHKRPERVVELWNFGHRNKFEWTNPRPDMPAVYTSNAEIWANVLGVGVTLNRPRLYVHENYPFAERRKILVHADGRSHGIMPEHVRRHILDKYGSTGDLFQIGVAKDIDLGIPRIETPTIWDLVRVISESRMLIGMDSGPSWIAACFPDVVVHKLRTTPASPDRFRHWIPLEIRNIHSHWDDRCHQIFNVTEDDIGFTSSYRKM
jgi:hypothetical protein